MISIVSTMYQPARYIEEFHQRISAAAREVAGDAYEIVLVNDGSPDASLEIALRLANDDPHLSIVHLSRNLATTRR